MNTKPATIDEIKHSRAASCARIAVAVALGRHRFTVWQKAALVAIGRDRQRIE
jgi:hypothetical protein